MEIIKSFFKGIINSWNQNHSDILIVIILGILCIILKKYYPKFRGLMGEFWLRQELNKLPKEKYLILNDIMIEDENGTHQIDHIVISNYGIFVIEMKNYYGLIIGREYDNKWCQHLGKTKNYFMNPIHQNYGHIKCLEKLLKKEDSKFISIICFSNQAKLEIESKQVITQVDLLREEILKYNETINISDLEEIFLIIKNANIQDRKKIIIHTDNINKKKIDSEIKVSQMICPKCDGKLIEKNGKYGVFTGCSNYPKCHYIKK